MNNIFFLHLKKQTEISHLNMADREQTDSSGKYTFGGGRAAAKKYWPTIMKSIELVSNITLCAFVTNSHFAYYPFNIAMCMNILSFLLH